MSLSSKKDPATLLDCINEVSWVQFWNSLTFTYCWYKQNKPKLTTTTTKQTIKRQALQFITQRELMILYPFWYWGGLTRSPGTANLSKVPRMVGVQWWLTHLWKHFVYHEDRRFEVLLITFSLFNDMAFSLLDSICKV